MVENFKNALNKPLKLWFQPERSNFPGEAKSNVLGGEQKLS